jgi:hypothetical protein
MQTRKIPLTPSEIDQIRAALLYVGNRDLSDTIDGREFYADPANDGPEIEILRSERPLLG